LTSSIDCGDKECSLKHRYVDKCTIFLHTPNKTDCQIPCKLSGCKTEIHHFMTCPIWECNSYTTTTSTQTTTEITETTTGPMPDPSPVPNLTFFDVLLYGSLGINGLFVVALVIFLLYKKYKRRHISNAQNARVPLLENNDRYFTLGSRRSSEAEEGEHIPLLPRNITTTQTQAECLQNYYLENATSPISLSSTPTEQLQTQKQIEQTRAQVIEAAERELLFATCKSKKGEKAKIIPSDAVNVERELMFARVTSFKPKSKITSTEEKETKF
jgi:hypothetical protein